MNVPCVIIVRNGVVDANILCRDAKHAEKVFFDKLADCLSNWDEYDEEDKQDLLEQGYEEFGTGSSVCLSWAISIEE